MFYFSYNDNPFHLSYDIGRWEVINMANKSMSILASEIPFSHEQNNEILKTFFSVVDYYKKHPNPGACHLISSIFYVLLKEQNIENELCLGEVKNGDKYFDHSWIEINGEVFDIAIQHTLDGSENSLVYAGHELLTGEKHSRIYGISSPVGFDMEAKMVKDTPFVTYMNGYPQFKDGAWKIVKDISKELRLKLDIDVLKDKYKDTTRVLKS